MGENKRNPNIAKYGAKSWEAMEFWGTLLVKDKSE